MKQRYEVYVDSFVDYAGETHPFVIAAVSEDYTDGIDCITILDDEDMPIGIEKGLRLGVAICHPTDKFDEKIGTLKAIGRAEKSTPILYSAHSGCINTEVVRALLKQEAEYLKHNPNLFIKGYNEAKERYLKNKEMNKLYDSLSEIEKVVIKESQKNPKFLDNVNTYLKWYHR